MGVGGTSHPGQGERSWRQSLGSPCVHSPGVGTFRDPACVVQDPLKQQSRDKGWSSSLGARWQEIELGAGSGRWEGGSRGGSVALELHTPLLEAVLQG